jgi:integrase
MTSSLVSFCKNQSQQISVSDQVDRNMSRFGAFLLTEKGLSRGTIDLYCKVVRVFLKSESILIPSKDQIQDRIVSMHMDNYSKNYIRIATVAMEYYSEFCGILVKFGRPKKDKPVVKDTLSEAEISIIIAACKNIREKAILSLMAYSGARANEICNIRVADVDFGMNTVRILDGKGHKNRIVCISGECVRVLLQYIDKYPRNGGDYLFTALRSGKQYTTWALRKLVKEIVSRTKISKRVHPHLFRHSLACNMLFRGANLLTIKEQLGHEFIETTMIYVRSRADRVAAEYRMFTPSYI